MKKVIALLLALLLATAMFGCTKQQKDDGNDYSDGWSVVK